MTLKNRLPDRKAKVTLRDIARLTDVSESTVSRILRNSDLVSPETRDKVMEVVREIGYVPNRIAGSLASLDSFLVGVIIPSLSNIVFPEVLQGIQTALAPTQLQPVISTTDYDIDREEAVVRGILSWKPAAILLAGFDHTVATRRMLDKSDIRVVEMMDIDSTPIDAAVGMSHRKAGHAIGRHLIGRGYRRFAYVGHDWNADRRARLRYEGLCAALAESGLGVRSHNMFDGASSVAVGRRLTEQLLAEDPTTEVAVYSNDDMAVGGVFHCLDKGIAMPGQLAIFGFNGLDVGQELPQPLSTLRSNRLLIGQRSVEIILQSKARPESHVIVDTSFDIIEGQTA